ncbi:transcription factor bHLH120 [Ziziphus jujuba]|uniref:Transcription factor bHLH120 n=1 Tax=Ziziphus jujuba TaxID=326968 RepID=A0A6P3ZWR2_ZIZJJ|nr:transcription factor bHLH120 [Ziziphus jujuba]
MFPLHQSNKSSLFISFTSNEQGIVSKDLVLDHGNSVDRSRNLSNHMGKIRPKKLNENPDHHHDERNEKKKLRREIERQRRQEMTTLYVSLRSLLPLELIKGKPSMSEHMNVAVAYIKHLEKKIQELSVKRNELKRQPNCNNEKSNCLLPVYYFTISSWSGMVEIMINSWLGESDDRLTLSRVLEVILEQGLDVVSCISTSQANDKLVYTIQSEVRDFTCTDQTKLQQRLAEVNPSWRYISK